MRQFLSVLVLSWVAVMTLVFENVKAEPVLINPNEKAIDIKTRIEQYKANAKIKEQILGLMYDYSILKLEMVEALKVVLDASDSSLVKMTKEQVDLYIIKLHRLNQLIAEVREQALGLEETQAKHKLESMLEEERSDVQFLRDLFASGERN